MSIKRLKFFQEMLHKLLLYLGKIRFALDYCMVASALCRTIVAVMSSKPIALPILSNSELEYFVFWPKLYSFH